MQSYMKKIINSPRRKMYDVDFNTTYAEGFGGKSEYVFPSTPHQSKTKVLHKSLIGSKSSPNFGYDDKENSCLSTMLFRNPMNDVMNSPSLNPHKSLIDLYKKYSENKGAALFRSFSLRKKKLNRLEDIYSFCNEENTFTVTIQKSNQGLGLCVCGGKDKSMKDPFDQLIRIWNLHPLQPALECGKLTYGDVILQVNGISMVGMTNTEAVEILRNASSDVELVIFRPSKFLFPALPQFKKNMCSENNSTCCSDNRVVSCPNKKSSNEKPGEVKVALFKQDGCLGFTIARQEHTKYLTGGIFIKALTREPAISDGRIKAGDRILQVNGVDVSTFSHSEAIHCLRNASDVVTLKICRSCSGAKACPKHSFPKVHAFNLIIAKSPNEPFGFCVSDIIDVKPDFCSNLLPCAAEVKIVYPDSIAHKNGIKIGDRILEVNGESLLNKTADEVVDVLRKTGGVVRMVFCRLQ